MKTGAMLKTLLSQREMTIKQLAEKTGIPINTLYSITKRNTDNIRNVNLEKILNALEITELEFYVLSADIVGDQVEKAVADKNTGLVEKYYDEFKDIINSFEKNKDRIHSNNERELDKISDVIELLESFNASSKIKRDIDEIKDEQRLVMLTPPSDIDGIFSSTFPQLKYTLFRDEIYLMQAYLQLNVNGRKEAIQRVMELGMINKYTQPDQSAGDING